MFAKALFLALIPGIFAANHAVTIGANNALSFTPTSVVAAVGDTLTFTVYVFPAACLRFPDPHASYDNAVSPATVNAYL